MIGNDTLIVTPPLPSSMSQSTASLSWMWQSASQRRDRDHTPHEFLRHSTRSAGTDDLSDSSAFSSGEDEAYIRRAGLPLSTALTPPPAPPAPLSSVQAATMHGSSSPAPAASGAGTSATSQAAHGTAAAVPGAAIDLNGRSVLLQKPSKNTHAYPLPAIPGETEPSGKHGYMTFVFGSPRYCHNVASAWVPAGGVQGGAPQLLQEDNDGWFRPKVHAGVRKYMRSQEEKLGQYCLERVVGWAQGSKAGPTLALVKWIGYPLDANNATWQPAEGVFASCKLAWAHLVKLLTPLAQAVHALTQLTMPRGAKPISLTLHGDFVGGVGEPDPVATLQAPPLKSVGYLLGEALRNLNVCLQVLSEHPAAHPEQMLPYYAGNSIVGVEGGLEAEAGGVKAYIESCYPSEGDAKETSTAASKILKTALSPLFSYKGGTSGNKNDKDAQAHMMVLWCEGGYRMRELQWAMRWLQAAAAPPSRPGVLSCMEEWLLEHAVSPATAVSAVDGHTARKSVSAIGQKVRALRDGWAHRMAMGVTCARRVPLHLCYVTGRDLLKTPLHPGPHAAAVRRTPALVRQAREATASSAVAAAAASASSSSSMHGFSFDIAAGAAGLHGADFASALDLGAVEPPLTPFVPPSLHNTESQQSTAQKPKSKKRARDHGGAKPVKGGKSGSSAKRKRGTEPPGDGTPSLLDDDSSGDDLPLAAYAAPPARKQPPPNAAQAPNRTASTAASSSSRGKAAAVAPAKQASRVANRGPVAGVSSAAPPAALRVPVSGSAPASTPSPRVTPPASFSITPRASTAASSSMGSARPAVAGLDGLLAAQAPLTPLGFGTIPMKRQAAEAIAKQWEGGLDTTAAQLSARVSAEAAAITRRRRGRPVPELWAGPQEKDGPCLLPGMPTVSAAGGADSSLESFADFDVALGRKHVQGGGIGGLSDAHEGSVLEAEVRSGKQRFTRVVLDEQAKVPKCASAAHVLDPQDANTRQWRVHNLVAARGAVHLAGRAAALPAPSEKRPTSWPDVLQWTNGWSVLDPAAAHTAANCAFLVDSAHSAPVELRGGAVDSPLDWTQATYANSHRVKVQWADVAEQCLVGHAAVGTTFFAGHDTLRLDTPALLRQAEEGGRGASGMAVWKALLPEWTKLERATTGGAVAAGGPTQPAPMHPPPPPMAPGSGGGGSGRRSSETPADVKRRWADSPRAGHDSPRSGRRWG